VNSQAQASPLAIGLHLVTAVGGSVQLVRQLHELHSQQWALEDATRYTDASADQIAVAKAAIDSCNSRRHRLIDTIDATVMYRPSLSAGRHYSETVGELCDRLLILDLKLDALDVKDCRLAASIRSVCSHLAATIDQMIGDMATGQALIPPRVGVKVYRQEFSAAVLSRGDSASDRLLRTDREA
jgi:hypothetical protein